MKASAGFYMRASSNGLRHAASNSRPERRRLSATAARSSRLHAPDSSSWNPSSSILSTPVVWTEATGATESVKLCEQIGEGTYGAVFRGVNERTGEEVAVKRIPTRGNGKPGSSTAPFKINLEADLHETVHDCESVATLKAHSRSEDVDYLIMEHCAGGDLAHYATRVGPLKEPQVAEIAREGTNVLRTCHRRELLHGDIKASNFVIKSADDASKLTNEPAALSPGWLKAIDFGCSMRMGKTRRHVVMTSACVGKGRCTYRVGTPTYWAPEVFIERYGLAADMWSFGSMLYQLGAHQMPFFTPEEELEFRTEHDVAAKLVQGEVDFEIEQWRWYSDDARDFVKRLLHREEKKRMTAEEAAEHPFLRRDEKENVADLNGARRGGRRRKAPRAEKKRQP